MVEKELLYYKMCDWLIDFFNRKNNQQEEFNKRKLIRLYNFIEEEAIKQGIAFFTKYVQKTYKDKSFYIKNFEIVKWEEGDFMDWHRDYPIYEGTTIVFLNDDYEGGELITAPDPHEPMAHLRTVHKPEVGKAISFLGNTWHKVNPVTKGTRYTLALWYHYV
jgi:predicted 2-oxoglutarate/Fe(II)-dependent dioxygenase YbiX